MALKTIYFTAKHNSTIDKKPCVNLQTEWFMLPFNVNFYSPIILSIVPALTSLRAVNATVAAANFLMASLLVLLIVFLLVNLKSFDQLMRLISCVCFCHACRCINLSTQQLI